jgi:hypothetical protein
MVIPSHSRARLTVEPKCAAQRPWRNHARSSHFFSSSFSDCIPIESVKGHDAIVNLGRLGPVKTAEPIIELREIALAPAGRWPP